MKRFLLSFLMSTFVLLTFLVSPVSAKVISSENGNITVAKGEVVDDDLFIGAQTVNIDGTVNGNLFVGAQNVKINGTINGSIYVGGENITITQSKIGGSVFLAGSIISMDKDTTVAGSVFTGAGNLSLDSQIKRSVYAGVGSINMGKNVKVGKDFYYASDPNQTVISDGAKVTGNTYKAETKNTNKFDSELAKKKFETFANDFRVVSKAVSLFGALIIGFLYLKLFGKHFEESSNIVSSNLFKSLGIGFLVMIGLVPAIFILLITVVGAPVVGVLLLVFMLYSYLAKLVVGMSVGKYLVKRFGWKMSVYAGFAVGMALIYVLKMVPVVGGFVTIFTYLTGLGALVLQTLSVKK